MKQYQYQHMMSNIVRQNVDVDVGLPPNFFSWSCENLYQQMKQLCNYDHLWIYWLYSWKNSNVLVMPNPLTE